MPCCQKSTGAGYIVLKRACSVFKRPHKTLTALPLFTHTPQSTKKYEIPGRRKPRAAFCPVLTLLSLECHLTSFFLPCFCSDQSNLKKRKKEIKNKVFSCRFSCFLPSLIPGLLPILLAFASCEFLFLSTHIYPHQKAGRASPQHSRVARGEHLCLPERWRGAGLFEFQYDAYVESSVSTDKTRSAPHMGFLPHSLSRFHILFHIAPADKRGSVCREVARSGSPRGTSLLLKQCGDCKG